jgi:hypothetical protein
VNLFDAATVKTGTGDWHLGWDGDSRVCGNFAMYLSECDPDTIADVIGSQEDTEAATDCGYRVIPYGLIAEFTRNVRSERDDDPDWLRESFMESAEIGVARGLLVRQGRGAARSDVWLGNPDVEGLPGVDLADANATAAAVSEGRRRFFGKTFGIKPILHVNPTNAIALKKAGVVELDPVNGEDRTAWGDPVVMSNGYYDIPDLTAVPSTFWTGPLDITLSEIKPEDVVRAARRNQVLFQASMLAAIDTDPCAMVRIGPAPVLAG